MQFSAVLLALAQAAAPAGTAAPAAAAAPGPVVELNTSMGVIKITLEASKAPITVENFLKYVRAGFYDGTVFHRVMPNFMIQGGGLLPDLTEKPTRSSIKNESKNGLHNTRGTIAMARKDDPDSATAQFFINVADNRSLDDYGGGYTVFGAVTEGMDVVEKIVGVPTTRKGIHQAVPTTPVVIKTARELKADGKPAPAKPGAAKPAATKPATPKPRSQS